jgi:hypothetical protein
MIDQERDSQRQIENARRLDQTHCRAIISDQAYRYALATGRSEAEARKAANDPYGSTLGEFVG